MPTSPSDEPPKALKCYFCNALLETPVVIPDSRQIQGGFDLGHWGGDTPAEASRCPKCNARQPWAEPDYEPQKAETD